MLFTPGLPHIKSDPSRILTRHNRINRVRFVYLCVFCFLLAACWWRRDTQVNYLDIHEGESLEEVALKSAHVHPSKRQLEWQKLEMTAFIHFGMNTFTNKEWGDGTENPALFNPREFDPDQWVDVLKTAGFKLLILTAKHHDGFCLWPSAYTTHSVKNSPWRDGQGDVVRAVARACRAKGMKFGIYLSPWDRHETSYGTDAYNDFFVNQLDELLSNYGRIAEVWFDGANGEGPNGKKQVYDWARYYSLIREKQPDAVIAVRGPDVRWVGTETGVGRETEWSVIPVSYQGDSIATTSTMSGTWVPDLEVMAPDLGSRDRFTGANRLLWWPAEVDVSLRPGWFYHPEEDDQVKNGEKLLDIYLSSVGRNAQLLLNVPPDTTGKISAPDANALRAFKEIRDYIFSDNLLFNAQLSASSNDQHRDPKMFMDNRPKTYWSPSREDVAPLLTFTWPEPRQFNLLLLQENIATGQKVEKFIVEAWTDSLWERVAEGTTIGYKRILQLPNVRTTQLRIIITEWRDQPEITEIGLFKNLPVAHFEPKSTAFTDQLQVTLSQDDPEGKIFVTIDGSLPNTSSSLYTNPIVLTSTAQIKALAVDKNGREGFAVSQLYNKARWEVLLLNAPAIQYTSGGSQILTDGVFGGTDFSNNRWLGFEKDGLEAIIDLGENNQPLTGAEVNFLHQPAQDIQLPSQVEIWGGQRINNMRLLGKLRKDPLTQQDAQSFSFVYSFPAHSYRFIKVKANHSLCTEPAPCAGQPYWLFIDEISLKN